MESIKKILRPIYVPITDIIYNKYKGPKRYHHLFDEIQRLKAISILEVGTWSGGRAQQMIEHAKKVSPKSEISYVGFDLFEDLSEEMYHHELSKKPPTIVEVEKRLHSTGANITLIKGNTLDTLPSFVNESKKFDFIFIDGGHHVETIRSDWNAVSKLMHANTVVIFDDYWRNNYSQSAKPVVDEIDTTKYKVEILSEIDCFDNPDFGRLEISFAKVTLK